MNKLKSLIYVVALFNLVGVMYLLLKSSNEYKLGYFKNAEVNNAFDYKLELEKEIQGLEAKHKKSLDSLENDYEIFLSSIGNKTEFSEDELILAKRKQSAYLTFKEQSELDYQTKVSDYTDKIWKQINEYTMEFGKEKGYDIVFGANGDGSLMYAEDGIDITNEIILFINKKYRGE